MRRKFMILRLIIVAFIAYLVYRIMRLMVGGGSGRTRSVPHREARDQQMEELVGDPICHVYLPISKSFKWQDENGEAHYFCSEKCREKYREQRKTSEV